MAYDRKVISVKFNQDQGAQFCKIFFVVFLTFNFTQVVSHAVWRMVFEFTT